MTQHAYSIGDRLRFSTTHSDGSTIRYAARVVKVELDRGLVWVEIPARVRALPFPPVQGKRYAAYTVATLAQWGV